jgi:hypothetical protein
MHKVQRDDLRLELMPNSRQLVRGSLQAVLCYVYIDRIPEWYNRYAVYPSKLSSALIS